jgi:ABC-type dipeptide/oligopeptide/nickel transport system permease component
VSGIIRAALPVTAAIVIGSAVLLVVTALLIGVGSALRPRALFDRTLNALIMCGVALHPGGRPGAAGVFVYDPAGADQRFAR